MSRARQVGGHWFDVTKNGESATDEQIELLSTVEEIDLDDLLDGDLSQGEVVKRLRDALGQNGIPQSVLERREAWREQRHTLPKCRICGIEGDSTKHHFVNKWILRELEYYAQQWADRTRNTIPVCIHCHRNLHLRKSGVSSIVEYLSETEKAFAEAALTALSEQHSKLALLLARGDDSVYESRLLKDWIEGYFKPSEPEIVTPATLLEQAT